MKKGFTLIELLSVITLLAIVALIAYPIISGSIQNSKEQAYDAQKKMIVEAAKTWGIHNADKLPDIDSSYTYSVSLSDLINGGYILNTENGILKNPLDNTEMTGCVRISYSTSFSQYVYEYVEECPTSPSEPETPESVSFALDSWDTIVEMVRTGKALEVYNVGDTKEVTVDGYTNGDETTFTVRIANMSTPEQCNNDVFLQTACGFVVEFVDIITTHNMNSTATNVGGWPASEMYSFVNEDIYNALPSDLRNVIIDTYTVSSHGSSDSSNFTSIDKLYLLSTKEVWGENDLDDTAKSETRQLDYYENNGVTISNYSGAEKILQEYEDQGEIGCFWFLRSADSNIGDNGQRFYGVGVGGIWDYNMAQTRFGVAPAFRIG